MRHIEKKYLFLLIGKDTLNIIGGLITGYFIGKPPMYVGIALLIVSYVCMSFVLRLKKRYKWPAGTPINFHELL